MATETHPVDDALIVGGGFYGISVALYLAKYRGLRKITIVEQESDLMQRASYVNQARVHNGYHYPRSFTTAYRSRVNFPRFVKDFRAAVRSDFQKIYAIARQNSKVTSRQFEKFCEQVGASLKPAPPQIESIFEPRLIERVYLVEEYAFDSAQLKKMMIAELKQHAIEVLLLSKVNKLRRENGVFSVDVQGAEGLFQKKSRLVFNCTYSGMNHLKGEAPPVSAKMRHEITEMALLEMPDVLNGVGVTVMDGPFFSVMPFPSRNLYTLSHVRYTPHSSWADTASEDPYLKLRNYDRQSRADRMIRDASRYIPSLAKAQVKDSLFEVKTILEKNSSDDGRPILFEKNSQLPGYYSILGGKIDNIYDVFERLDNEGEL